MKKWVGCLLATLLLLVLVPPVEASAAAGGELAVHGRDITVTLRKPDGVAEAVTSLRFWMYVTVLEGDMRQPVFTFAEAPAGGVPGVVKDAAVAKQGNRYVLDLIVSGKKEQDIFQGVDSAVIGTLTLYPASQTVKAEVGVAGEGAAEGAQPVVTYISASSPAQQAAFLTGVNPVSYSGSSSDVPAVPEQPGEDSSQGFSKDAAPKLKLRVGDTGRHIAFSWKQVPGASGYKIYQYQEETGKYKRIKTIKKGDKTSLSLKMDYAATYKFRMRAFQTLADGAKDYGAYSAIKQVTTAPAKVKGLAVQQKGYAKSVLAWEQAVPAGGYQVFCSTSKDGVYTRVKTVKQADVCKYVIKGQEKKKMYYKVRAYVEKPNGKRKYGAFSRIQAVKQS